MSVPAAVYKPSEQVVIAECDNEAVLFHIGNGVYYGLDEVGSEVWSMLGEGRVLDEIVRKLLERYNADEGRLRSDVQRLLNDLQREELIEAG